jgi:Na+/H+ antiporter NhaA
LTSPTRPTTQSAPLRDIPAGIAKPLRDFIQTESGSAGLLLIATVVALAWANSPWSDSYFSLWATQITVDIGDWGLSMDLAHWVNDGLMSVFFFVIGLELRHEISVGDLRQKRRLVVPAIAAVGGIAVPALLYLVVNPSGDEAMGWGIVIGTDTAFVLGALALVGPKVSSQLRVFILTATIADDLLAVAIIGAVYSDSINLEAMAIAIACLGVIALLGWLGTSQVLLYVVAGFGAWLATMQSGLHPSIVGMLSGILVVAYVPRRAALERAAHRFDAFRQAPLRSTAGSLKRQLQRTVSVNERLQEILHPWTSFVIVPVFAVANAGVDFRDGVLGEALRSPVMWGVVLGLVAGKPIGIASFALTSSRLNLGPLPRGLGPGQLLGGGALSGMGFSVSILIVGLAFDSEELRSQATVGVLLACALSVLTGWLAFRLARVVLGEQPASLPTRLEPGLDLRRDHIRGPLDAPLTLVEYGDFECPFCGAATNVVSQLRDRFGDELRYVFRHLPLADVHPHAELAAEAAEAAAAQGMFWEMHDQLFHHHDQLQFEDLVGYAANIGLDVEEFTRALSEGRHRERVRQDAASAEASGAEGTPTFFIDGLRHIGPWDADSLTRALTASREREDERPVQGAREGLERAT